MSKVSRIALSGAILAGAAFGASACNPVNSVLPDDGAGFGYYASNRCERDINGGTINKGSMFANAAEKAVGTKTPGTYRAGQYIVIVGESFDSLVCPQK